MLKVGIIGGRDFGKVQDPITKEWSYIPEHVALFNQTIIDFTLKYGKIDTVVSGGANGADTMGEEFADKFELPKIIHYPDWKTYGRSAGFIRNKLIVDDSDLVISFWDGKSKGTKSSIDLCSKSQTPVLIVNY